MSNEKINKSYKDIYSMVKDVSDLEERFNKLISLTDTYNSISFEEKLKVKKRFNKDREYFKVLYSSGEERNCENCHENCFANSYCENCIRHYKFQSSSGNNEVDNLIKNCQSESINPCMVVEWIPYNHFHGITNKDSYKDQSIQFADWNEGNYCKWDKKEKKLIRFGNCKVVLKSLKDDDIANRTWIDEV